MEQKTYKIQYAYTKDNGTPEMGVTIGPATLIKAISHVHYMASILRKDVQIVSVQTTDDGETWTDVPDWADQERIYLNNQAEIRQLMKDIDKDRYTSLDDAGRARLDEADRRSEAIIAAYQHAEDAEYAFLTYQMALPKPERDALRRDSSRYDALSRLFFSARSPEKLKKYAGMTVDELVELAGKEQQLGSATKPEG